ncbi:unnamed protein product, partial [marine sediment metagenome]
KPGATGGEITRDAAVGGALQGATDFGVRTLTGGLRIPVGGVTNRVVKTINERLRTISETLGGRGTVNKLNQRTVNRAAAESIGEVGVDVIDRDVRARAAKRIGKVMDENLPTGPVDVTQAFVTLDEIPAANFPGKKRVMEILTRAEVDPKAWQDAMSQLRTAGKAVSHAPDQSHAGELFKGLDELGEAGITAGADATLSRTAREQYKNLMLLESISSLRRTGNVSAFQVEDRLFKG